MLEATVGLAGTLGAMTTNQPPLRRATAAALLIPVLLALVASSVAVGSASEPATIRLQPGYNAVTWNGAAPYPIADFAETPVIQVHRWDAVGQEWLSHFVGRDGASLPELHLLPRVQYLLVVRAAYEIEVPDPIAEIDPHATLRFADPPDDPLRFEAYWPNEDSPLEDLILLRPDDERLSVKAEVAGGVGKIEVYWILDGRLNHQGLQSDDVELLPGKHDDARLTAVDGLGQAVVVRLPRVVKLPPFELAQPMSYGIVAYDIIDGWGADGTYFTSQEESVATAAAIARLGVTYVRFHMDMFVMWPGPSRAPRRHLIERYDQGLDIIRSAGLKPLPVTPAFVQDWASAGDVTQPNPGYGGPWQTEFRDLRDAEEFARQVASRWPQIEVYEFGNELNIKPHFLSVDPIRAVEQTKALALGIWYENPNAIIVSASLCCFWFSGIDPKFGVDGVTFLEAMYQAGFGPWHDIAGIHSIDPHALDRYRFVMSQHGDGHKPLWDTETHSASNAANPGTDAEQAQYLLGQLLLATERGDVHAIVIHKFMDDDPPADLRPSDPKWHVMGIVGKDFRNGEFEYQAPYWAIREFLTGQPPPSDD